MKLIGGGYVLDRGGGYEIDRGAYEINGGAMKWMGAGL